MTTNRAYGRTHDVYIVRKGGNDTYVMGGIAQDGSKWTRVLTTRAAQMLWFHLARHLFPSDADDVTSILPTAGMRGIDLPSITQHAVIQALDHATIEVIGYTSAGTWTADLAHDEIQRFWESLDQAMNT
ncbi:MAG: hypothetical protein IAE80_09930 [Anaerolinea sp.]|nr:hypothetical protein [Anaerolinea sp.]